MLHNPKRGFLVFFVGSGVIGGIDLFLSVFVLFSLKMPKIDKKKSHLTKNLSNKEFLFSDCGQALNASLPMNRNSIF